MDKEYYILLGWLLGVLSMLIRERLQEKKEERKKEIDILSENLKFIFSTGNIYNNIRTEKITFEKMSKTFPDKAVELKRKMYENFDESFKEDFFPQLMFQSFELKRLKDKSYWHDFEIIVSKYEELGKQTMAQENKKVLTNLNSKINQLKKAYVEKCLLKTKV